MSDRYLAWQVALQNRDMTLVSLAVIAVSLVAAWCMVDYLPERIRPALRRAYLYAGVPLYLVTIYVSVLR